MVNILQALVLFAVACFSTVEAVDESLVVQTSHGKIQGTQYKWTDGSLVNAWRGVPFGKPPVGDLRWRAPEPAEDWNGTVNCRRLKNNCIQPDGSGTEDCLYLNVYSTGNPKSSKPLPVMFYIYGGSLMGGAANAEYGAFVSHAGDGEGVIVVEVSYRLNMLGFLAFAELSQEQGGVSGNYGIQDQVLGLKWVQDNIAQFNGDPNLVTICGQSSGGTSVFALLASPSSQGLFHRAISLSGSPNMSLPMHAAEAQNADIIAQTGCQGKGKGEHRTYAEVLACMRKMTPQQLTDLIPESWDTPGLFGLPLTTTGEHWAGLVIVDGKTIPFAFDEALARGDVSSNVPFMVGAMGQECDEWPEVDVQEYSPAEWRNYLVDYFMPWDALSTTTATATTTATTTDKTPVGEHIYNLYLNESSANPQKAYDSLMSDYGQNCANVQIMQHALPPLGRYKAPIYHFVNNYHLSHTYGTGGENDDRSAYVVRYAFHVLDYLMALEQWSAFDDGDYQPDDRDLQGARLIQNLWYNFMVSGNPTPATTTTSTVGSAPAEWNAANDVTGWPQNYNTYVIQSDNGVESATVVNYSSDKCSYLHKIGVSEREFWWCN